MSPTTPSPPVLVNSTRCTHYQLSIYLFYLLDLYASSAIDWKNGASLKGGGDVRAKLDIVQVSACVCELCVSVHAQCAPWASHVATGELRADQSQLGSIWATQ